MRFTQFVNQFGKGFRVDGLPPRKGEAPGPAIVALWCMDLRLRTLFILGLASCLTACGSGGSVTAIRDGSNGGLALSPYSDEFFYGACDARQHTVPANRQCREWRGDFFASFDLSVLCANVPGTFSGSSGCPAAGLAGVCVLRTNGSPHETVFYYYSPDWNAATGAASCTAKASGNSTSEWMNPVN